MAGKRRADITEKDVSGFKYFDKLAPCLERLHDDACQRDTAGNRTLHYDEYCMLLLLYLFTPIVSSLRALQQASELDKLQQRLGTPRVSLGSAEPVGKSRQIMDSLRNRVSVAHESGPLCFSDALVLTVLRDAERTSRPGQATRTATSSRGAPIAPTTPLGC